MHSSGVGKATLAHLPSGEVDAILASASSIDAPALRAELELSRERGFALDDEEQEIGVRCLAVHVPGAPVPAALSTSSPTSRLTEDVYDSFAKELHAAAAKLTAVWEAPPKPSGLKRRANRPQTKAGRGFPLAQPSKFSESLP